MKRIVKSNQEILGMARVGFVDKLEVYVNTDDGGNIPHFHIRDKVDWKKFHSCVKILSAEYFEHEGKEDTLSSKQRKELQTFMLSKVDNPKYLNLFENTWKYICFLWDMNNSAIQIPEDAEMPNYRELR